MVTKPYDWEGGAVVEEHSRRKHKILAEYFYRYLQVRCSNPQQRRFRLAVVDGFAGAGRYGDGTRGSPILFIEELQRVFEAINLDRLQQGFGDLSIECLLFLNDAHPKAAELLQINCEPLVAALRDSCPTLHLSVVYSQGEFEHQYPAIRDRIAAEGFKSVLYNLDQCGYGAVSKATIIDIMRSSPATEVFFTFAVQTLLAYLNPELVRERLRHLDVDMASLRSIEQISMKHEWLGAIERLVFETFSSCAPFASPFSIQNPSGWRYWLIHFAKRARARQVYNDVLHANSSSQAHFGRPGLNMLSYNPREDGVLYLFDMNGRDQALKQLFDDIPRLLDQHGDTMNVGDFYEEVYNLTPAHSDDIHAAMINNPDLEVITPTGGARRSPGSITIADTLRLKIQRSFLPLFIDGKRRG